MCEKKQVFACARVLSLGCGCVLIPGIEPARRGGEAASLRDKKYPLFAREDEEVVKPRDLHRYEQEGHLGRDPTDGEVLSNGAILDWGAEELALGSRTGRRKAETGAETTTMQSIDWTVAMYFVSFVFVGAIIAINVVVSVMFEGFVSTLEADASAERIEREAEQHHKVCSSSLPLCTDSFPLSQSPLPAE